MSVDLVGSTAYKAKEVYPVWVRQIKFFYHQFNIEMVKHYKSFMHIVKNGHEFADSPPKLWKIVGDEIIFCVRVNCFEHLSCCIQAFVQALASFGELLNKQEKQLDVKGSAWIASFPAPNVTIVSIGDILNVDDYQRHGALFSESDEIIGDINPSNCDFQGAQIDAGFRVSKFAHSHELVLSIELAWLLTLLKKQNLVTFNFIYKGKESLKGVMGGMPYPIIVIQTERMAQKRELEELERSVAGSGSIKPIDLYNYITKFMEVNAIEFPVVKFYNEEIRQEDLPKFYQYVKSIWKIGISEEENREKTLEDSEKDSSSSLDSEQSSAAQENAKEIGKMIDRISKKRNSSGKS